MFTIIYLQLWYKDTLKIILQGVLIRKNYILEY